MKVLIINGPNLNLLGRRQPEIYGSTSFADYLEQLRSQYASHEIDYFQSNSEGELIDRIHSAGYGDIPYRGIVINAGAYSHTSIAIADALAGIPIPAIEVHISNVYARESFRHHSYLSAVCKGSIVGLGLEGYRYAINFLLL